MSFANLKRGMAMALFGTLGVVTAAQGAELFHRGGVGSCDGCHSMHSAPAGASAWLLQGNDASSICLNCHAGLGAADSASVFSPNGSALTPGGDFYWLTKNFSWVDGSSPGESHGHNVIAMDFGLMADPLRSEAPGGTYSAGFLGCTSCHDPHGKVKGGTKNGSLPISQSGSYGALAPVGSISGNYRLLGDSDYDGGELAGGFGFLNDAPVARQNVIARFGETDSSHVDYGSGMSEWCANCHASYQTQEHSADLSAFEHPAGNNENLESEMILNYNSYISTGNFSGNAATAFLQFVPFERALNDPLLLDPTSTQGPDASSNVMCLTCHRAHASAFRAIGRWDFEAVLLVDSHPGFGDSGVSGSDVLYSYYGRDIVTEFGAGQLAFCEKCHDVNGP